VLRDARIELGWQLRQALPWSPRPRVGVVDVDAVREASPDVAAFDALAARVDVGAFAKAPDNDAAAEAVYAAFVLDHVLRGVRPRGRCLDVGAKNGALLPGLCAVHPGPWTLVELDVHRRYADLTTRGAHARALAARFDGCRVHAGDVTSVVGRFGLVTWFLPFVVPSPHLAWGLPRRFFRPKETLAHVLSLVDDGGALVIVNQGAKEADAQRALLAGFDVCVSDVGVLPSTLSPYTKERHAFVVHR